MGYKYSNKPAKSSCAARSNLIFLSALIVFMGRAGLVSAQIISEIEPNDSISGAQSIPGGGVTINGTGNGTFDYYGFNINVNNPTIDGVAAATSGTFETTSGNFDTELFLYDSAGNLQAQDDDGGAGLLSRIDQTFNSSGSYAIGVGKFNSVSSGGAIIGNTPDVGDNYTLQIDITDGNSIAGAFNIDGALSDAVADIAATGDGTFDYYMFTAAAGQSALFEIILGNFDTELFLFDLVGTLLAQNDDFNGLFSLIDYTFASDGIYAIGVGKFNSVSSGGAIIGNAPDVDDNYTLSVSLTNPAAVSEPATFALFSFGLIGLGVARRWR